MNAVLARAGELDDATLALGAAASVALLLLVLILLRMGRTARTVAPLTRNMAFLADRIEALGDGQSRLSGGLTHVSEAQAAAQSAMLRNVEERLAEVTARMTEGIAGSATRTAASLGALQERLAAVDRAQTNIEKLSGDVLGLQDILSNKQTRGAFGEIQLRDIVSAALPADAFTWQATLSNGKRADCLIHLPQPPGPIAVDAKFPLEAYEALRRATGDADRKAAERAMRTAVRKHIRDVAERYIVEGTTADGALMFLPSEAVYAELHGNFPEVVRDGFAARVWIVSPTTCMATLTTMRAILKDARMRAQAGEIRAALALLNRDVELVSERVGALQRHFGQARDDLDGIGKAADRAGGRAARLHAMDFEGTGPAIGDAAGAREPD